MSNWGEEMQVPYTNSLSKERKRENNTPIENESVNRKERFTQQQDVMVWCDTYSFKLNDFDKTVQHSFVFWMSLQARLSSMCQQSKKEFIASNNDLLHTAHSFSFHKQLNRTFTVSNGCPKTVPAIPAVNPAIAPLKSQIDKCSPSIKYLLKYFSNLKTRIHLFFN
jgi:hypothetical protein